MLLGCWEYRMNRGHTQGSVCILHRLTEGIWLCKLDQIQILNSTGFNWCETVQSANCTWIIMLKYEWNKETKKCEDWDISWKRMLSVTKFIQLIQKVPYQGSSWRVLRLQKRISNSHCDTSKWSCAAGWGRTAEPRITNDVCRQPQRFREHATLCNKLPSMKQAGTLIYPTVRSPLLSSSKL